MKKLSILFLSFALLSACTDGSRLSVEDGLLSCDGVPVGRFISVADASVEYSDEVDHIDESTLKITRTFTALNDLDSVRLTLDFRHDSECLATMIPSVTYDGNDWGRGKEPKGFKTDGVIQQLLTRLELFLK